MLNNSLAFHEVPFTLGHVDSIQILMFHIFFIQQDILVPNAPPLIQSFQLPNIELNVS